MKFIYQKIFKEVNGYKNYLICPYVWYNNFEVLHSVIELDKVDLECAETVKAKPTRNYSDFITYSNKIYFYDIWLDNIVYLIT